MAEDIENYTLVDFTPEFIKANPDLHVSDVLKEVGLSGHKASWISRMDASKEVTFLEFYEELYNSGKEDGVISNGIKIEKPLIDKVLKICPELGSLNRDKVLDCLFVVLESYKDNSEKNKNIARANASRRGKKKFKK